MEFKDFSRHLSDFPVLFKADLIFKHFSRKPSIFKYFSSLWEPCINLNACNLVSRKMYIDASCCVSKVWRTYFPLNSVFTIIIIPTQDYLHNRCIRQEYSHLHTLIEVYTLLTKCLHWITYSIITQQLVNYTE